MILKIYAVKDVVVGNFMLPFYLHNDNEAKRSFNLAINSEAQIAQNWKDLQLFSLGEWNDETGEITTKVEFLANGAEYKKENKTWSSTAKATDQQE